MNYHQERCLAASDHKMCVEERMCLVPSVPYSDSGSRFDTDADAAKKVLHRYRWLRHSVCLQSAVVLSLALLCSMTPLLSLAATGAHSTHTTDKRSFFMRKHHAVQWKKDAAPNDNDCRAKMKMPCYSPAEMRSAYNVDLLTNVGLNGAGQTIVIIDSFGSPTVAEDLKQFDKDYGLPDPPSFKVLSPLGTVPFDAKNSDMVGWAQETNMDVQWAHAIAPGASIVLLTSPVSETQGVQGMPQFLALERYALDHNLGSIISQSWGTTEETLFTPEGTAILNNFNNLYRRAASKGVTMLASSGDTGVVNPDVNNNNYKFPTVEFPASSPYVTAVGGTSLFADTDGAYQSETVWNSGAGSATGGGFSHYFKALDYQSAALQVYSKAAAGHRGVPDVAYNGDPTTSIPIYLGFMATPGYYLFGGTSAGSPQWAGLIAIANQIAGHPLGFINPLLYKIGVNSNAFHDITLGNNTQGAVTGYSAGAGWDPVTGWGTPRASFLIAALINASAAAGPFKDTAGFARRGGHMAYSSHHHIHSYMSTARHSMK